MLWLGMERSKMRRLTVALLSFVLVSFPVLADEVELKNGDKLDVKVLEENDSELVVEHPQLGRMIIKKEDVKPEAPPNPGLFGTSILRGWSRNLGAGWSGSSGNSSDSSVNLSLAIQRSAETFRGDFTSAYFFASKDSEQITNQFFANYQHDFLLKDSKFFIFVRGRYQYDEFQAWKQRVSSSTGVGYDILSIDALTVSTELGIGFSRTWGSERKWKPEGVVSMAINWEPLERHSFSAEVTYYPDLADLPEFRLLAEAAYTVGISRIAGLSLKFGAKNEYDSGQPGDNNNLNYYGNLVYDF